jgi:hypothetical protein
MGDAELLDHILIHGLGCGKFSNDQLGRELVSARNRSGSAWFYLPLLAALFIKPISAIAQVKPDTAQTPTPACKQESYAKIEKLYIENNNPILRMGGAIAIHPRQYKRYGVYWGWLRITLFKKRLK